MRTPSLNSCFIVLNGKKKLVQPVRFSPASIRLSDAFAFAFVPAFDAPIKEAKYQQSILQRNATPRLSAILTILLSHSPSKGNFPRSDKCLSKNSFCSTRQCKYKQDKKDNAKDMFPMVIRDLSQAVFVTCRVGEVSWCERRM